jgi:predicted dehydrogenase
MLRAGKRAQQKNLKIAGGLMCRHSVARQEFVAKVRDGDLGVIQFIRAYRMGGAAYLRPRDPQQNEIAWQIRNRSSFHWVSSGRFIEYLIHQIDECCWLKDGFPVAAQGLGGRIPGSPDCGQNLDTYSVEFTYADGTKALVVSRDMNQCQSDFATYVHGAKRAGQFSGDTHRATVHTYKDQRQEKNNIDWRAESEPCTPWQAEWSVLLEKIRKDEPHNETERCIHANFAALMARAAVHTGQIVTWDQMLASQFQFCPNVDRLSFDSPAPVSADAQGRYPAPIPGVWVEI